VRVIKVIATGACRRGGVIKKSQQSALRKIAASRRGLGLRAMSFVNAVISAASGLLGVLLGGWWSDRREREKRRTDFMAPSAY
jgi:hypothetical protein